jgi:hypothetical protein
LGDECGDVGRAGRADVCGPSVSGSLVESGAASTGNAAVFSVFDDLSYRVDDGTVTLFGEGTRPILKSEAEGVVKHVEGVTRVVNNIEVLPLSSLDDQIRARTYRAIFGYARCNVIRWA